MQKSNHWVSKSRQYHFPNLRLCCPLNWAFLYLVQTVLTILGLALRRITSTGSINYFGTASVVQILYDLVATKCYEIATDKSGCCILQQCVEHAQGKQRDRLVAEITAHALLLAENRYGLVSLYPPRPTLIIFDTKLNFL